MSLPEHVLCVMTAACWFRMAFCSQDIFVSAAGGGNVPQGSDLCLPKNFARPN